ncbi:hypothetical protein COF81_03170 [Bacillus pseudomycoides]|uniref:Uncharacterized protein n=1 Tax=Bacillus pseudomycoides TaxID=64104 RepID=A0ABD6TE93_9BACI|nr:hypothetical protein [Bacillus pseudomycoides]PHF04072.1 hypothetical protein COF81_03170 [Bacillus pseudomycoides]
MSKDTLKNIFHVYCFYKVRLQGDAEPSMRRNKLVYENPIQNHYESFIGCLREFCEVRSEVLLHSFYQFVVDAVNSLNKQERILIYERYLHKDHYKSNRRHYIALDMKSHQYDKLLRSASGKIVERLGINDLQLTIPDWMKR